MSGDATTGCGFSSGKFRVLIAVWFYFRNKPREIHRVRSRFTGYLSKLSRLKPVQIAIFPGCLRIEYSAVHRDIDPGR